MKIGVYTIALNEAKFAQRWAHSVAHADFAMVADTGSTDDTKKILESHVVSVHSITVRPWRFDDARNAALALMPDDLDVLISLDMDEVLAEGWRPRLERAWQGNRLHYGYAWSPQMTFLSDKIAGRFTHRWKHPVHEVLVPTVPEVNCTCQELIIEHLPDSGKSRGQYLDLLKLAVAEQPEDDRCKHYLGREEFFWQQYEAAIKTLSEHLAMPKAVWVAERASSMRFIGKCYEALGDRWRSFQWYNRAVLEDGSRDSLIEAARIALEDGYNHAVIDLCERARATAVNVSYMTERYANNEGPYDLAAVAYFRLGERDKAVELAIEAVRLNPDDARLRDNLRQIDNPRKQEKQIARHRSSDRRDDRR